MEFEVLLFFAVVFVGFEQILTSKILLSIFFLYTYFNATHLPVQGVNDDEWWQIDVIVHTSIWDFIFFIKFRIF